MTTLICLAMVACTTLRPIEGPLAKNVPVDLAIGDEVRAVLTGGTEYRLKVTRVGDDSFDGEEKGGKVWKIRYDRLATIEKRKVSVLKTGGLVIGVLVTVSAILIGVLINGYNNAND